MKWLDNLIESVFHTKAKKEIDDKLEFIKKTSEHTIRVCDTELRCIELQVSYADRFRDPRYTISIFKDAGGNTVYRADLSTDSKKMSFAFTQHDSFVHVWSLDEYMQKEELEEIMKYAKNSCWFFQNHIMEIYIYTLEEKIESVRKAYNKVKADRKRVLELIK